MLADGGHTSIIGAVPGNDQAEMSCAVSFKITENLQGFRFAHVLRVVLGRRKGQKATKMAKKKLFAIFAVFCPFCFPKKERLSSSSFQAQIQTRRSKLL
jgi:hypothetical protein